jgi:uncharacterized protein (TIGR00297 family)
LLKARAIVFLVPNKSNLASFIILLVIILAGVVFSLSKKKLTPVAAFTGSVLALVLYRGLGFTGVLLMTTFFLLGTIATSWRLKEKQAKGVAEKNKDGRTAGQVLANAGVAGFAALGAYFYPAQQVFAVMAAAAFSSAAADTLSSELGNIYGKRFYNILSFKKDQRGLDGVISLEGTLIGVAGSAVIASVYAIGFGWNVKTFLAIVAAGTVGNLTDSILGATLERKGVIKNDVVNFLNTLVAAAVVLI